MTAKEYLKQYEYAHRKAMRCRKEYENEMQCIDAVRSLSDNDGMPHGSGISKPTEQKAIRLANAALKWKTAELEALEIKQQIFQVINGIQGIEGDVLFGKYIELKKWEEIAEALHFSVQHVYRIHGRALQIVSEKMRVNESKGPAIMIASEGRPEDRTT